MTDQHSQRLGREAQFLLVFASPPPIKSALLERLGACGVANQAQVADLVLWPGEAFWVIPR